MDIQNILTSNVVNLNSIKDFFSSDKDMVIQLIEVYLSDTGPRTETLKESLKTVDYVSVKNITHFLKSSLGLMGVDCLKETATLEKLAEAREKEEIIKEKLNFIIPLLDESLVEYQLILGRLKSL
jgi:HPt (histidine-containing phosphotransfer) domain-containing protein